MSMLWPWTLCSIESTTSNGMSKSSVDFDSPLEEQGSCKGHICLGLLWTVSWWNGLLQCLRISRFSSCLPGNVLPLDSLGVKGKHCFREAPPSECLGEGRLSAQVVAESS